MVEKTGYLHAQDPYLTPCAKINSKWIKDLNVRPQTLKLLQKKMGKTLEDKGIGNYFSG
jgi:hypothetical protein